jgi:CMP-N,N'-diacetyllegionaminic acid synthase
MIQGYSVLAIVPARGGSKGISKKNIHKLAGKPLIAWTIEEAKKSRYIDRVILSSEDEEIIGIAKKCGCEVPFIRPNELAKDDTPGIEPVLHALRTLPEKYDYVVLLQPTSPLRLVVDIDGCIELCILKNAPAAVSVTKVTQHPYWMFEIDHSGRTIPFIQERKEVFCRQDLPDVYILNGAVYVSKTDWLLEHQSFMAPLTVANIMPRERSFDIDDEIDLNACEAFLNME